MSDENVTTDENAGSDDWAAAMDYGGGFAEFVTA